MNRVRKLLTNNAGLKLLSLGMAVALWAAVGSDPVTEAAFRVPIEFINVPANLEVLTDQPSIQLWARGPSHAVRQAEAGDFVVRVNVARASGPGERTFSLDPATVAAPTSLQVVELIPSEVKFSIEPTVTKDVPIVPRFSGDPAPGYRVKDFHVSPSVLRIIGPASHVNAISSASTDLIDLSHLSENKTLAATIRVPDPLVRLPRVRAVQVTVEIEPSDAQSAGSK